MTMRDDQVQITLTREQADVLSALCKAEWTPCRQYLYLPWEPDVTSANMDQVAAIAEQLREGGGE